MSKRTLECPACGLSVVMNEATREILHESPLCQLFEDAMKGSGMKVEVMSIEARADHEQKAGGI